jgi:hypothetical protein
MREYVYAVWGLVMKDKAIEALKSYERMQKAIFDAAQQYPDPEPVFVPYGVCPRHLITISNGMFDSVCPMCESINDEF